MHNEVVSPLLGSARAPAMDSRGDRQQELCGVTRCEGINEAWAAQVSHTSRTLTVARGRVQRKAGVVVLYRLVHTCPF